MAATRPITKINPVTLDINSIKINEYYTNLFSSTSKRVIKTSLMMSMACNLITISGIILSKKIQKFHTTEKLLFHIPRMFLQVLLMIKIQESQIPKKTILIYLFSDSAITIICSTDYTQGSTSALFLIINSMHTAIIVLRFFSNFLYVVLYFSIFTLSFFVLNNFRFQLGDIFCLLCFVFILVKEYVCKLEMRKTLVDSFDAYHQARTQSGIVEFITTGLAIVDSENVYYHNDRMKKILGVRLAKEIMDVLKDVQINVSDFAKNDFSEEKKREFGSPIRVTGQVFNFDGKNADMEMGGLKSEKKKIMDFFSFLKFVEDKDKKSKINLKIHNNIIRDSVYEIFAVSITYQNKNCYLIGMVDETAKNHKIFLEDANLYKDKLLSYISHNLKTPLNRIFNYLESQIESVKNQVKEKRAFFRMAMTGVQDLLCLTQDIKTFTDISNGCLAISKQIFDLQDLTKEILAKFRKTASNRGIQFQVNFSKMTSNLVFTSKKRLKQVLVHLIENALRHTTKGYVHIVCEEGDKSGLKIRVIDTGSGITARRKAYLAKAMKNPSIIPLGIQKDGGSLGLGLIISSHLAKLLAPPAEENPFTIESDDGIGTEVALIIDTKRQNPIKSESTAKNNLLMEVLKYKKMRRMSEIISREMLEDSDDSKNSKSRSRLLVMKQNSMPVRKLRINSNRLERGSNASPADSKFSQKKIMKVCGEEGDCGCSDILLVDDDDFNISILTKLIEIHTKKYSISKAYNGKEAFEYLSCVCRKGHVRSERCRLVITDINMPIMGGKILAKKIKNGDSGVNKSIMVVGCTANIVEEKTEYVGFDDMMTKPLKRSELVTLVDAAFSKTDGKSNFISLKRTLDDGSYSQSC